MREIGNILPYVLRVEVCPMRNSPRLPLLALYLAAGIAILLLVITRNGDRFPLTSLELGLVAATVALTVYGVQGLFSVILEGIELAPGKRRPRLTEPLSIAIVVFSVGLFAIAVALGWGITESWPEWRVGVLAGAGSLVLAFLLMFYKEAFLGTEACFDDRHDGVPW